MARLSNPYNFEPATGKRFVGREDILDRWRDRLTAGSEARSDFAPRGPDFGSFRGGIAQRFSVEVGGRLTTTLSVLNFRSLLVG